MSAPDAMKHTHLCLLHVGHLLSAASGAPVQDFCRCNTPPPCLQTMILRASFDSQVERVFSAASGRRELEEWTNEDFVDQVGAVLTIYRWILMTLTRMWRWSSRAVEGKLLSVRAVHQPPCHALLRLLALRSSGASPTSTPRWWWATPTAAGEPTLYATAHPRSACCICSAGMCAVVLS